MASPTELLNLNNSYNNDGKGFDVLGIGEFAKGAADMFAGASNLINFFNKTASSITNDKMEEQYLEMAKAFNYNAEGQELTINFPLFNTTIKDSWKTNYRFLVLFLLRNLPFKVSTYSYKPPLLYDIVVPGINHLPLCYVSNISIQHYGLIRHLTCKSIFEEITQVETNKFFYSDIGPITRDIQVPVPEAWFVTIKFKCLLSNTSNLMLDLANVPINIKENEVTLHA